MLPRQPDGAVCWHNGFRRDPMLDLRRREVVAVLSGVVMILPLGARANGRQACQRRARAWSPDSFYLSVHAVFVSN